MVETVGTKLRRARTLRQISLDDAARATKIRAARLSDLEGDMYTNFPNIAYAKGFLTSYGRYLGVDVRPFLDAFEDTNTFGLDDYQYLSEKPLGAYRVSRRPQRRQPQRRGQWKLVAAGALATVLAIGLFFWVLVINVQRLGDLGKLADHQEAREHPSSGKAGEAAGTSSGGELSQSRELLTPAEKRLLAGGNAGRSGADAAMGEFFFVFSSNRMAPPPAPKAPFLPLPGDGSVLREMTLGSSYAVSLPRDADRSGAPAARDERLNSMAPPNHLGYRFFVHALGGNPGEAFEDDAQRAPVRVNNSLE
jgi:transcriptional regulator with XRE-family HTH domain